MRAPVLKSIALIAAVIGMSLAAAPAPVSAQPLAPQQRLCDPTFEDCRADILTYIQQETVEIDMAFWAMTDARYANALVAAAARGVKIRLLMDPRCADNHEACQPQINQLAAAGLPMRNRLTSGILHWKMILFAGQGQVEFAGANFAPFELTPDTPWVNFTDEIVMFTNDPSIVHSFMRKFDDLWVSTTEFDNYANVIGPLQRSYPMYSIDPQLNFPPDDSYRTRSIQAYAQEQQAIDVLMFRITDEQQSNAIIAAVNRGIPVRLISDTEEYRNPARLWDAYNVDKMYNAGVQVRLDDHQGINHEKAVLLRGLGMSIFGSSNWTSPSTDTQREHNMFTTQPWIFDWLEAQFTRKWTNGHGTPETKAFVPLPPDVPVYNLPAGNATGVPTTGVSLSWNAGLWAHNYDIYFGTTPNPPLLEANKKLGPSQSSTDYRTYALPELQPGTTYYWKIVSKTMAFVPAAGPVWSFQTAGTGGGGGSLPSGWSHADVGATGAAGAASFSNGTFTVAGAGADVWGTADAFHYAYRTLNGDGTIVARVASVQNVNAWTKAGVMMRDSLSSSSAHGFMLVAASASKGTPFQRRTSDGNITVSTSGAFVSAPYWVKLVRAGSVITAYESSNGTSWTTVASDSITMGASILVGLAVSSHVPGTNATAAFDNVTVTEDAPPPGGLPSGWSNDDIGATGAAGSSTFSGGTFTVTGAGADVWGTADALQYAYKTVSGDFTIVARVASIQGVNVWTKAGVMVRNSLSPSAAQGFMLVAYSSTKGVPYQRRTADGNTSVSTSGSQSTAPRWVKLVRSGSTITGYESADGGTWIQVGSDTFTMGNTVLVGLGVSSHVTGTTASATFDNVTIQ
jgi:PLD-like domain